MAIELLHDSPEMRLGQHQSLLVSVWFSELTERSLDAMLAAHTRMGQAHGKLSFLSVVVSATKAPPKEIRDRLERDSKSMMVARRINVVAVPAKGLPAIIARTFLAAMSLFSNENMVVVSSVAEAVAALRAAPNQDPALIGHAALLADVEAFIALPRAQASLG